MLLQTGNGYVPLEGGEAVKWEEFGCFNHPMEETYTSAQNTYHELMWIRNKLLLYMNIFIETQPVYLTYRSSVYVHWVK